MRTWCDKWKIGLCSFFLFKLLFLQWMIFSNTLHQALKCMRPLKQVQEPSKKCDKLKDYSNIVIMPGTVAVPVFITSWHKQRPSSVISSPSWPQSSAHMEQVALSCHRWGGLGRSNASLWAPLMLRWEAETGVQVSKLLMPGGFPWWMACPWCWQTCLSAEPPVESFNTSEPGAHQRCWVSAGPVALGSLQLVAVTRWGAFGPLMALPLPEQWEGGRTESKTERVKPGEDIRLGAC